MSRVSSHDRPDQTMNRNRSIRRVAVQYLFVAGRVLAVHKAASRLRDVLKGGLDCIVCVASLKLSVSVARALVTPSW